VDRVVYAADRHDAGRGGFDDREFYDLFARDCSTWHTPVEALPVPDAVSPFDAWLDRAERVAY
jgi:guanine deaminase